MPVYSYACGCGHKFDMVKAVYNRNKTICPKCGKIAEIKFSTFQFIIK